MPEKIFTIPINEAFDSSEGCPMCRLYEQLEETTLSYVLGAAMMEPDVRIKMNEAGFCDNHFSKLRTRKNKLALALILESHLAEVNGIFEIPHSEKKGLFSGKQAKPDCSDGAKAMSETCFVCKKVNSTEKRYFSNVAFLWDSDEKFREKLKNQPFFCVSHSAGILEAGKRELKSEKYASLYEAVTAVNRQYLERLRADIKEFTVSFDHRNAGQQLSENAKQSIDKAIEFLK